MTETREKIHTETVQQTQSPANVWVTCYTASKLIHATKLLGLRDQWPKIHFTARWPVVRDISSEQSRPAAHWLMDNVDDIIRSQVVLVYVEKDDHLKGGLVEVGIAWAHGKQIYLVGDHEDYSKWKFLPRVHRCKDLEDACRRISSLTNYKE